MKNILSSYYSKNGDNIRTIYYKYSSIITLRDLKNLKNSTSQTFF